MDRQKEIDICDKLLDRIGKSLEMGGFFVSREITYYGARQIADRLGCSLRTVWRLVQTKKLLYYYIYRGRARVLMTNETMIRLTLLAWHDASASLSANSIPPCRKWLTRGKVTSARQPTA